MEVVHQKSGDEVPSLDSARMSRFIHVEKDYCAVRDFLIALSQEASGAGTGAVGAFRPAGSIRQLLDVCTELGSPEKNKAALSLADATAWDLGSSTGVIGPGLGQKDEKLESALREGVEWLCAAARYGHPALETVDRFVQLILPFVPKGIDLLRGTIKPS